MIRDALVTRSPLLAQYRGQWLTLVPHALGWRGGQPHLVAYRRGTPGEWLCLPLFDLTVLRPGDASDDTTAAAPPDFALDQIELSAAARPCTELATDR